MFQALINVIVAWRDHLAVQNALDFFESYVPEDHDWKHVGDDSDPAYDAMIHSNPQ